MNDLEAQVMNAGAEIIELVQQLQAGLITEMECNAAILCKLAAVVLSNTVL